MLDAACLELWQLILLLLLIIFLEAARMKKKQNMCNRTSWISPPTHTRLWLAWSFNPPPAVNQLLWKPLSPVSDGEASFVSAYVHNHPAADSFQSSPTWKLVFIFLFLWILSSQRLRTICCNSAKSVLTNLHGGSLKRLKVKMVFPTSVILLLHLPQTVAY